MKSFTHLCINYTVAHEWPKTCSASNADTICIGCLQFDLEADPMSLEDI